MEMEKFGKILVVDDNADVLFTINNQLAPRCEWVKVAYTPERALRSEERRVGKEC